jgi:hypothetical protein
METKRLCDARNIPVILAAIPSINLFWMKQGAPQYLRYLLDQSEANGVVFVDLAEAFWPERDIKKYYMYPWDNHLSPAGHRVVADQLHSVVRRLVP